MKCKKISLAEATKEVVYSDVYGFVNSKVSCSIVFNYEIKDPYNSRKIEREISLSGDEIYIKKPGSGFAKLSNNDVANIFKIDIYALKTRVERIGYYGYSSSTPTEQNVVKIDSIKKVSLKWQNESVDGAPNNKKPITEFLSKEVYEYSDDFNKSEYLYDYEIKEKQFVRFNKDTYQQNAYGTYQVVEVYPQPNKENKLCKVCSVVNGNTKDIIRSSYSSGKQQQTSTTLYKVPYEKYPDRTNELDIFDYEICERKLSPLFERCKDGDKGNLYWQAIEGAACYKVSLYKYRFEEFVEKKLYLLEEFDIDRNKHWITIDNLYGYNFIVRLIAENREGLPLAVSRGIPVKFAGKENEVQYWNAENKNNSKNMGGSSGSVLGG